jgi:hypothetical protein
MASETLRAWAMLEAEVNGRAYLGAPGVRDPQHPCDLYQPTYATTPRPARAVGDCRTDGHYLCTECPEMSAEALEWRADVR